MLDFRQAILTLSQQAPDAPAVIDEAVQLSRGALAMQAGGVAQWALGLPDRDSKTRIIAILAPAGAVQVAAMLGVAASGAAFMPIDPALPPARMRAMLERAEPVGLLHTHGLQDVAEQLSPDFPCAALEQIEPAPLNLSPMQPDAAAYVMFTSGSTGVPKGILGRYKSLNHFLGWQRDEFGLDATVRSAQLAPVTFDVSLRDVLLPLVVGGVVTIPPRDIAGTPRKLLHWLHCHDVTLLHCVPSVLRLLTAELEASDRPVLSSMKHLFLAGEPLLGRDVKNWCAAAGSGMRIVNLYGPSETTLAKVFSPIDPEGDLPDGMLPIGQALPDTDVLILKTDRVAVVGEIGEICIRTRFPSLGYLNDPEATRAGFQRNPFGTQANDIVYRSGDMGRQQPDGMIACLGRRDNQVKIAGNRVEGGEVEATLRGLDGITACVVVINRDDPTDPFLVSYVTGEGADVGQDALRAQLAAILPAYMLPRFIVALASLPTLMNGKVDKRALPKPMSLVHGTDGPTPANSDTEHRMVAIWQEILGIESVGVETPFANMGGDSLKAIKTLGAMYHEFGVELRIADFFAARTIRAVAALLDAAPKGSDAGSGIPKVTAAAHDPLSDAQEPLWAMQQIGLDPSVYNLCFGFRVDAGLDIARLERAFGHLIASHEILRTQIQDVEGTPRQVIVQDVDFRIEHRGLTEGVAQDEAVQALLEEERQRPFDLGRAPLLRVVAAGQAEQNATFLIISFHHAVCDGQSLNTVVTLLGQAYANDAPLPVPDLQYRDVVAWQEARLQGEEADRLSTYWRGALEGAPRTITLPEAKPRPARQQFKGATIRHDLPSDLGIDLATFARDHDSSLFNALLTGLAIALDQRADQQDMVIATPVLGRNHPNLADQIGFFANTLCLRVSLDREQSIADSLAKVTQAVHGALDHQEWPFNRLVADLNEPRDLSRNPVCNVMLVLFDADRPELTLPSVEMSPFGRDTEWAFSRFDLVFHVTHDSRTGALVLDLNHDTALFDAEQVRRIAEHYQTILEQITRKSDALVHSLTPYTEAQTSLIAGLDRVSFAKEPATLTALWGAIVSAQPDAVAVTDDTTSLSYAELDKWANGIAATLLDRGVRHGQTVAVSGLRCAAGIAAMLGILKAGAAWVALDERWPDARVQTVLAQSGAVLEIDADVSRRLDGAVWAFDCAPNNHEVDEVDEATIDGLAYVVFTSGSTGTPKGVMIEHQAVANMVQQQIDAFDVTPDSRILQFAAPVFDAHVSEVFVTLLGGGHLIIPAQQTLENPVSLKAALAKHAVTHATFAPSFLNVVRDFLPDSFKVLITAGEAARADELRRLGGDLRLLNAYGPAENSVCSTIHEIDVMGEGAVVPIGKPINGTGLALLDGSGRSVPVGVPGEITLHGVGLARGYLGQADVTSQAFQAASDEGHRSYATGDMATLSEGGDVVFIGRCDDQVKISGQRVEISEVEASLSTAPDVARAIVSPITGPEGRTTLGAWVLKKSGRASLWPSVAEFFVYDDVVYQAMAGDRSRNIRYHEGFARYLPGQTVLEVGPGPYAILSRMAIEAGARHVYAVEINPEIADRARNAVVVAGLQDRITVLTGDATDLVLPEPVDWCISEIVGGIGGSEGAAAILNGVRKQLVNPANMLPRRSVTRIAAVDLPLSQIDAGFSDVAADYVRRIFAQRGRAFDLRLCLRRFDRRCLLSTSDVFEDLDFTTQMRLEDRHDITLEVQRDGALSGFVLWLTMDVGANRDIDVLNDTASWLPVYVPLGHGGFSVRRGDRIEANVIRSLDAGGRHPDFTIEGKLMRESGEVVPIHVSVPHMAAGFGDSPLQSHLFDEDGAPRICSDSFLEDVRHHAADQLPRYAVPGVLREIETLPLTVNGKLARDELPDLVVQGASLSTPVARDITPLTQRIADTFAKLLKRDDIDPTLGFFELGGDSILAVRAVGALAKEGIEVTAAEILHHQNAMALGSIARTPQDGGISEITGPVQMHPVQSWYLSRDPQLAYRFNQSVLVTLPDAMTTRAVEDALRTLVNRHDALRMRFDIEKGQMTQAQDNPNGASFVVEDLNGLTATAAGTRRDQAAECAHSTIDPVQGTLLAAVMFEGSGPTQLLMVAHHLAVDMLSWQILVSDLVQLLENPLAAMPPTRASYASICAALAQEAVSPTTTTEKPFWDGVSRRITSQSLPPPPREDGMLHVRLDIADHELSLIDRSGDEVQGRVLHAMAQAADDVFGWAEAVIDLETHGRDLPRQMPDASAVVGWFTRVTPIVVSAQKGATSLSELPHGGLGFGLLVWGRDDLKDLRDAQTPLALNYLGDLASDRDGSGSFEIDWNGLGNGVDPALRTGHALSVLAHLDDGGLFVSLTVDKELISEEMADDFAKALRGRLLGADRRASPVQHEEFNLEELAADLGL